VGKILHQVDVSGITGMSYLFEDAELFNQDLSDSGVSNVADMERMFSEEDLFDQSLAAWGRDLTDVIDD